MEFSAVGKMANRFFTVGEINNELFDVLVSELHSR